RKTLRLVSIGHSLGPWKKRILHRRAMGRSIRAWTVYSDYQAGVAATKLGFSRECIAVSPFHADCSFFGAVARSPRPDLVVAFGGEHGDYATFSKALEESSFCAEVSMGSAWARRTIRLAALPKNINNARRSWIEIRTLYANALAAVVPLTPCDFPAGISA